MKHLLTGQERTVWHLQYTDWPEHGCPEDLKGFLCECPLPAQPWLERRQPPGGGRVSLKYFLYVVSCKLGACFKIKMLGV